MPNVNVIRLKGSHYEMGLEQGRSLRAQIHIFLSEISKSQAFTLMKPKLLPTSIFVFLAKRRATGLLLNDIVKNQPKQMERMKGISDGAKIDLSTAMLLQSFELLIGQPSYSTQACTTLAFPPERTMTDEVMVAKNFDYLNELAPYQLTCEAAPEGRFRTLGSTIGTLPGMLDGMSENGLTVTYNLAFTTDKPSNYVPLSMVIQEMLETCRNTEEAVEYVTKAKRGGHDALLTLADPSGDIRAVELSSNHSEVRRITDGQMINTNHYHCVAMCEHEVPREAVYSGAGVPKEWLGRRIHESSENRHDRAKELLKGDGKVDEDKIISVLRDHSEGASSNLTICQHGPIFSTIRSVIFYPQKRTMKILYGNTCENEYSEIKFS